MWEGQERVQGNGSEWSVSKYWEAVTSLVNDVFGVDTVKEILGESAGTHWQGLMKWFKEEPVFLEAIKALQILETLGDDKLKGHAQHKAGMYMIDDNKESENKLEWSVSQKWKQQSWQGSSTQREVTGVGMPLNWH